MHSPPARAPKSQLAVDQPSTGGHWNLSKKKKKIPHVQRQRGSHRKPQQDGRKGTITIKSSPIPAGWVNHKLENNNTKEVLPLLGRF